MRLFLGLWLFQSLRNRLRLSVLLQADNECFGHIAALSQKMLDEILGCEPPTLAGLLISQLKVAVCVNNVVLKQILQNDGWVEVVKKIRNVLPDLHKGAG